MGINNMPGGIEPSSVQLKKLAQLFNKLPVGINFNNKRLTG
jgi:hypothetical protein